MLQKARGSYVSAEEFNALVDIVNQLARLNVGPGLELRQGAGGPVIALASPGYGDAGATLKTLACTMATQDTDTWDVEVDGRGTGKGGEVQVLTDARWTGTDLKGRFRTLKWDKYGRLFAASAEGAEASITAGTVRSIVTDVEYSTGTGALTHDKRTITFIGSESGESTDTVDTAVVCT